MKMLEVYGLSLKEGGRLRGDHLKNPDSEWHGLHLNEVLGANKLVLVASEEDTWVVSDYPLPNLQTVSHLEIYEKGGATLFSGRVHHGHVGSDITFVKDVLLSYVINECGRMVGPADSSLAKVA